MENQLFRTKSLDRISSPEELHDYMRVTSPRLWMLLTAIVVLLAGFIIFAATTTLENSVTVQVAVMNTGTGTENGQNLSATCSLPADRENVIKAGMAIRIEGRTGQISRLSENAADHTTTLDIDLDGEAGPLPDGKYDAVVILESMTPMSFLWN